MCRRGAGAAPHCQPHYMPGFCIRIHGGWRWKPLLSSLTHWFYKRRKWRSRQGKGCTKIKVTPLAYSSCSSWASASGTSNGGTRVGKVSAF